MSAPEGWIEVFVRYCTEHQGIADVDQTVCDFQAGRHAWEDENCKLHDLFMRSEGGTNG
jgi:hypothetical protein